MTLPYLFHGQSHDWVTLDETKPILTVRLATEKGIHFDKVLVRHEPDNEEYLVAMTRVDETPLFGYLVSQFPTQSRSCHHALCLQAAEQPASILARWPASEHPHAG